MKSQKYKRKSVSVNLKRLNSFLTQRVVDQFQNEMNALMLPLSSIDLYQSMNIVSNSKVLMFDFLLLTVQYHFVIHVHHNDSFVVVERIKEI